MRTDTLQQVCLYAVTYLGLCDFHLLLRHCTAAAVGTAAAAACARNHKPLRIQQAIETDYSQN